MKYDVFISYSSKDQKVVEAMCAYLEQHKVRCFVAYRDIPKGLVWAEAIVDALEESKMMVVVFSEEFNISPQVDREIELASEDKKPILTFRISDAKFKGAKKYYLKNLNWIDAFPEPEKLFDALLENVYKLIGQPNGHISHTPPVDLRISSQVVAVDTLSTCDSEHMLEGLVGLGSVKREIEHLTNRMRLAIERHEDMSSISRAFVFSGNPGTGKTTVARIIARIYKDMGLVSKGHLVEVSREHLCGRYVGETAIKTQQVIDSALDGILFVDEAYRLADGGENDFGKEALDTILARMENDGHRLVVIFAGYKHEMSYFYNMNIRWKSRITYYLHFDDYSSDEMTQITVVFLTKMGLVVDQDAESLIREFMIARTSSVGVINANGRTAKNIAEKILEAHKSRILSSACVSSSEIRQCSADDVSRGLDSCK